MGFLLPRYLAWHYSVGMTDFLRIWGNFFWFFFNFFSIALLLRTLFTPFQRLDEKYAPGLQPGKWAETLTVNILMRFVGAALRLFLVAIGIVAIITTAIVGALLFLTWVFAPLSIALFAIGGFWLLFS